MTFGAFVNGSDAIGQWDLWFRVCDEVRCTCREVLVLATREGIQTLLPIADAVDAADPSQWPALARGVLAFKLDLDLGTTSPLTTGEAVSSEEAALADGFNGAILESMHDRWLATRGFFVRTVMAELTAEQIQGHQKGMMVE